LIINAVRSVLLSALSALGAGVPAIAQCGVAWAPGFAAAGPAGSVYAVLPLPNGDMVAGGVFAVADAALAANIARWDGTTWRPMTSGANSAVFCLARMPNGDVVAGGAFTAMGGQTCSHVARWNGAGWAPIGTGLDDAVRALLVLPNGDLIAGGDFAAAGAVPVGRVARWNGTGWSPIGTGFYTGSLLALAQWPNGDLAAAGAFLGGFPSGLFRWNGAAWQHLDVFDATSFGSVTSMAVRANGDLALAGSFRIGGVDRNLAIWNGTAVQALLPPITIASAAPSVLTAANGDLCIGSVVNSGASVARWNGASWSALAGAPSSVVTLAEDANARLVVGAGELPGRGHTVARLTAGAWQPLGAPLPPTVRDVVRLHDDSVVVGGEFLDFRGVAANNLARQDGSAWSSLGAGVDGRVRVMALAPNGDLVVAGAFQNAGGAAANRIARWNGAAWSPLGAGLPAEPLALAVAPNGDVWAALNSNTLSRFQGTVWSSIPTPAFLLSTSLAYLANGDLAIGSGLGGLVVYSPSSGTFTAVPGSPGFIRELRVDAAGMLFAAGSQGLRSWDGMSWTTLLGGAVLAVDRLPNGDLIAGGGPQSFGGAPASGLFRRGSTGWQNFGILDGGAVESLAVTERGEVFAAGSFGATNGAISRGFAAANATCPATAQVVGAGCSGGAGPVVLTAQNRPWVGGTLRAAVSGMTANSLAVQLIGVLPATVPLPGGAAGCSLFVNAFATTTLLPIGGVAQAAFVVPPSSSLAGLSFRQQVVGVELSTAGIVRLTSSNALQLLIGLL
jgi:trimeric autotransporter adhesin